MSIQEFKPETKVIVAAVTAVTATYMYFLLFAQFGFLKILQTASGGVGAVKPIMAVMGVAGMTGSVLAAWLFTPERSRSLLKAGFALSGSAAALSFFRGSMAVYFLVALMVGLGTGLTSVTLAGMLRRALGGEQLGTFIGLGTGLAYGFCNMPVVFDANAATHAVLALLVAGAGMVAASGLFLRANEGRPIGFDYSKTGMAVWVVAFFALVCLDSVAFYIIQHTPSLKVETWSGAGRLEVNAGMHFAAAVLAGYALDQRWAGRTVLLGAVGLLAACYLIDERRQAYAEGALLYTAGVSIYSTVLIFYPARGMRLWVAALVYAVAGWGGSALGIGLAENRSSLPSWYILAGGAIVGGALTVRYLIRQRKAQI